MAFFIATTAGKGRYKGTLNSIMALNTFHAFKSMNFRLYFIGQSISLIGTWMQRTAVSWVIYERTHSRFMLGLALFASLFPTFVFSFLGGIAADRYDRFRLMLVTQIASFVQATLVTIVVFQGNYSAWSIIILSILLGIINAFDIPARQTIVYDLVGNEGNLPNALALNSSMVNLTRLIGPGLAGLLLQKFGAATCFGLNAVSYVAVIGSLLIMRLPKQLIGDTPRHILTELREGFHYILSTPPIRSTLLVVVVMSLLVIPFITLIPVYAIDIFHGDAGTFGIMESAIGGGAFAGAIYLASIKQGRDLRKVMLSGITILGICLPAFALVRQYHISIAIAAISGTGMMIQVTSSNTLLQTQASKAMRGRVVSYFAIAYFGMQPIGSLLVGLIAERFGTPTTVFLEGLAAIAISILYVQLLRRERFRPNTSGTDTVQQTELAD